VDSYIRGYYNTLPPNNYFSEKKEYKKEYQEYTNDTFQALRDHGIKG
jgi:hypothetical protein